MQRAGDVTGMAQGVVVLQCPDGDHPDLGTTVVDEDLTEIGRVVDVFGPVEQPYLAVSPDDDDLRLADLLGATLYSR